MFMMMMMMMTSELEIVVAYDPGFMLPSVTGVPRGGGGRPQGEFNPH